MQKNSPYFSLFGRDTVTARKVWERKMKPTGDWMVGSGFYYRTSKNTTLELQQCLPPNERCGSLCILMVTLSWWTEMTRRANCSLWATLMPTTSLTVDTWPHLRLHFPFPTCAWGDVLCIPSSTPVRRGEGKKKNTSSSSHGWIGACLCT